MIGEKALAWFHGEDNFNCAQAVLKAFQEECGVPDAEISEQVKSGGGRADGGVCGALFAAMLLAAPEQAATIEACFVNETGSSRCREIRATGKLDCRACVALAARLLSGNCRQAGPVISSAPRAGDQG
jgi:hypothetical protein